MSDEKRTATDEMGRNETTDDTEGQSFHGSEPALAIPGQPKPGEAAVDDDTEGQSFRGAQPAPAIPGQPKPGEAAVDDDTEGHGGCVNH
jgi:hypothetical protein